MGYFGKTIKESRVGQPTLEGLDWNDLGKTEGLDKLGPTEIYFTPMDKKTMEAFRQKFAGSQAERADAKGEGKKKEQAKKAAKEEPAPLPAAEQPAHFNKNIELRVAKILKVDNNPEGDKLYVETMDDGSGKERIVQSGLRQYLKPEDLLGKNIILAANLAPRKMRGIESHGMLLAADYKDADGKDCVEVLTAPWAKPGDPVILEGADPAFKKPDVIDIDTFCAVEIKTVNKSVQIGGVNLVVDGKPITTDFTVNGDIH